tara:strand:- start:203 stop:304 length:102 start_codon:yes stop_codon:yes gene_type:complete
MIAVLKFKAVERYLMEIMEKLLIIIGRILDQAL